SPSRTMRGWVSPALAVLTTPPVWNRVSCWFAVALPLKDCSTVTVTRWVGMRSTPSGSPGSLVTMSPPERTDTTCASTMVWAWSRACLSVCGWNSHDAWMVTVGRWSAALPYTADWAMRPPRPRAAAVPMRIFVFSFMVCSPPSVVAVAVVEVVVVVWAVVVGGAGVVAQAHAVAGVAVVEPVGVEDLLAVHALDVQ